MAASGRTFLEVIGASRERLAASYRLLAHLRTMPVYPDGGRQCTLVLLTEQEQERRCQLAAEADALRVQVERSSRLAREFVGADTGDALLALMRRYQEQSRVIEAELSWGTGPDRT